MKRTVSIPVNLPHERFLPLMGFCADIFNQHIDWALKERTWNKNVCKHIKRTNRHKSRFCCKNCAHQTHADLNAAKNVRDDYILSSTQNGTEEQASVNAPYVSGESHPA